MEQQSVVQSVERTFLIIEILANNPKGLGLLEISKLAGLHKSTAHRLLSCLIQMGYAAQDSMTGAYKLSFKLFALSSRMVEGMDILSVCRPHLDRLSTLSEEAVHLVIPSETSIVYIYKVDAVNKNAVRMSSRVGLSIPMYCTGCGKALLAQMTSDEVHKIWEHSPVRALTPNTLVTLPDLEHQLEEIRRTGYAVDNEENETGVRCLAVAINDFNGRPLAAFSISAPIARMNPARMEAICDLALSTRRDIVRSLGY